jgi:hypothetical protein
MNRLAKIAVFVMIAALVTPAAFHGIRALPSMVAPHSTVDQEGQVGDHDDANQGQTGDQNGKDADNDNETQAGLQTSDDDQAGDQGQAGDTGQAGESTNTDTIASGTAAQVGQIGQIVSQGHPNGPANAGDQAGVDQQAQSGSQTNVEFAQTGPAMA